MSPHIWIAFIALCDPQMVCTGKPSYQNKASALESICLDDARNWALQMKALTDRNYGYGCKAMTYKPPLIKEPQP